MITGDELICPVVYATADDAKSGAITQQQIYFGETLRQRALREFMCAIVSNPEMQDLITKNSAPNIAESASILTEAYFNELNKSEQ